MAKFKIKKKDCLLTVTVKLNKNEIIDERQFGYFTQKNIRGTFKGEIKKKRLLEYTGPISISVNEYIRKLNCNPRFHTRYLG
jgi:hypothetical protein